VNKKLTEASLVLASGGRIALSEATSAVWTGRLTVTEDDEYHIEATDLDGRTNEYPAIYDITALPDEPPDVRISFPRGDDEVLAIEEIPFAFEVSDDFGLESYGLQYEVAGREPVRLACERHLSDLEHGHERGLWWDSDEAERARRARDEAEARLADARSARARAEAERTRAESRRDSAAEAEARHRDEAKAAAAEAARARDEAAQTEDPEAARAERDRLKAALDSARETTAEARARREGLERAERARARRRDEIARALDGWRKRRESAGSRVGELNARLDTATAERDRAAAEPAGIAAERERLEAQITEAEARHRRAADSLSEAEGRLAGALKVKKSPYRCPTDEQLPNFSFSPGRKCDFPLARGGSRLALFPPGAD